MKKKSGQPKMKHEIGLLDGTMLVAGSMIGSGIFIVSADITRHVGSAGWLIVVWLLTGFMTITAAVSYGELSGMFPKAGGQYVYLKEEYNKLTGFLYGWSFFAVIQTGTIAAVGVAFSKFAAYLYKPLDEDNILFKHGFLSISAAQLVSIVIIVLLTYINTKGIKSGKIIQNTFTITKLLSLFGLVVFGLFALNGHIWHANWTNAWDMHKINPDGSFGSLTMAAALGAIAAAMVGSIFSSDAWNNITFIAGEVVNPKRNIGSALFLGTLIVTIIYCSANVMYTGVLSLHDIAFADKDRVAVAASNAIFGNAGTFVIAVMIMISTFGCNNGLILSGARVYYSMAKDGLFFKRTGTLNKYAVPEFGLWIQALVASILCLSGRYGDLLDMISFVVVVFYVLTIFGIYKLRVTRPDHERPYKAFGYPVLPALYIIMGIAFCILLLIYKSTYTLYGLGIVLIGIPIYYIAKRNLTDEEKLTALLSLIFIGGQIFAQSLQQHLETAFNRLQADSQCRYASVSLTVLDAQTGKTVFTVNPDMGLATASTLKTITTVTAFNLLGKDFQYQTQFGYVGLMDANGTLNGDVIIKGAGDPTLGSWRYETTHENYILTLMVDALRRAGIKRINGRIIGDDAVFGSQSIPEGWIWEDIGNYYGAGTSGLCWRENQYDIKLKTGPAGSPISIMREVPAMPYLNFKSELVNAPAGTGDNAYAFLPVGNKVVYLRGTYAIDQYKRSISVALPDPAYDVAFSLTDTLNHLGIVVGSEPESTSTLTAKGLETPQMAVNLTTILSPHLSQIVYWLNQRSINLYAEQLLKTMAWKAGKQPTTANGVEVVQDFWKARGIDPNSLNIVDGSGLSPGDRVTTLTMATILQSAKSQPWFPDFYASLPTYNNMKMKSGSILNVLTYAGYQTYKGRELCFSIMVNNYNGSEREIRDKVFRVLDELK